MARPNRSTVDYFPHDTKQKRTLFILKSRWGNDGYAFWFQLLEILGHSEGHYYDCSVPENWEYLVAYTGVNGVSAPEILNTLSKLNAIDPELWEKHQIIWSDNFFERLNSVYQKRLNLPEKHNFRDGNNSYRNGTHIDNGETVTETPQSKVKKRKLNKRKEKKEKKQYLEYVYLTDKEYARLIEDFGEKNIESEIEDLDNWIGRKPEKRTKDERDHNRTIRAWLKRKGIKKRQKKIEVRCDCGQLISLEELKIYKNLCPVCGKKVNG